MAAALAAAKFATWPWQHWAAAQPDALALTEGERWWNWDDVAREVERYAAGLVAQGVKPDHLVAIVAPNSIQLVWLLLAVMRVGARSVGLNPKSSPPELAAQLRRLDCDFLWTPAPISEISARYSAIELRTSDAALPIDIDWQPERPLTLTLTSGSTGAPKAVVHAARTHLASAQGLLTQMDYQTDDCWLLSLPLFHISGMAILWRWLYRGARLRVADAGTLNRALLQVTHASLVPTQLQRLLAAHPDECVDGRSDSASETATPGFALPEFALKEVLLGGAMIPVSLTEQAEQAGIRCWCGYGMTEMASTVTAKRADGRAGVGMLLPHRELTIRDGEIYVRGETLALGYYRQRHIEPLSAQAWFATKDLAHWEAGELVIHGRADNMFISGGENVQPESIEQVLLAHPEVTQAIVLPIADPEYGQRPVALIQTKTATTPLSEPFTQALKAYMAAQVTAFRRPVHYLKLPEHLSGGGIKISRRKLADWLAHQPLD
ncbi:o-succinylbenzoate--CoA ligase [Photobacterium sp. TY1-4]|uniref:o-succinylbenzoate--CoA ligase n=1 Tax=Photobacterium sp. TY1-4 TaxID=2899122 RepID=UPI0021C10DD8|nr:o-succinylbenzoate--CoA ligase [Photobacterium sp. TY1-4]UXI00470.1 o-succinylbenzoate--CoA ligase [Photobacterium sp. TY1-4]